MASSSRGGTGGTHGMLVGALIALISRSFTAALTACGMNGGGIVRYQYQVLVILQGADMLVGAFIALIGRIASPQPSQPAVYGWSRGLGIMTCAGGGCTGAAEGVDTPLL